MSHFLPVGHLVILILLYASASRECSFLLFWQKKRTKEKPTFLFTSSFVFSMAFMSRFASSYSPQKEEAIRYYAAPDWVGWRWNSAYSCYYPASFVVCSISDYFTFVASFYEA
jgi:hypothetical protein